MKPAILDRQLQYSGYFNVETLRIQLADGFIVSRDMERHGDAVAVLPGSRRRTRRLFKSDWQPGLP
jgi:hypothetical protein